MRLTTVARLVCTDVQQRNQWSPKEAAAVELEEAAEERPLSIYRAAALQVTSDRQVYTQ